MDPLLIVIIAVVVLAIAGVAFVASRPKGRGEVLDPPASSSGRSPGGSRKGAVLDRPRDDVPPSETAVDAPPQAAMPTEVEIPVTDLDEELEALLVEEAPPEERPTYSGRLGRLRGVFSGYLGSILARSSIDEDTWDELEEALIRADVGIGPTTSLLDSVRADVKQKGITSPDELIEAVKQEMKARLAGPIDLAFSPEKPTIWLFVGVNGVGKTTTIGKIGRRLTDDGLSVTMAAGDTFRAAAAEQLGTWADKCGADLVRGEEGGDPSAVIFDAVASAAAGGKDVVLADTAGRLHTKTNLMEELSKVRRVADKGAGQVTEVLLVIDAVVGQNGLEQAKKFAEATDVTGVVLTKLDGSAKGGIVFAIRSELGIPIKLVGLGESALQLVDFDADAFVDALFEPDN